MTELQKLKFKDSRLASWKVIFEMDLEEQKKE